MRELHESAMSSAMNIVGQSGVFSPCPRPPKQRGPADSASNTSQYSGSGRGSQPPTGGKLLPCYFAFMVGCRRATWKVKSTPMALGRPCSSCSASIGLTLSVQLSPRAETPVAPADLEPAASLIAKLPAWKIGWEKYCQYQSEDRPKMRSKNRKRLRKSR